MASGNKMVHIYKRLHNTLISLVDCFLSVSLESLSSEPSTCMCVLPNIASNIHTSS